MLTSIIEIHSISTKYLHFDEDIRPPYCGTWTKEVSEEEARSVARNPCTRVIEFMDYDNDSEAEWNELDDGEDVRSEGDDDAEGEETADDMDGFLDNAEDHPNQGLVPDRPLEWAGVLFEKASGVANVTAAKAIGENLMSYKMGSLIPEQMSKPRYGTRGSILRLKVLGNVGPASVKPWSNVYWGGTDEYVSSKSRKKSSRIPLAPGFDSFGKKKNSTGSILKPPKPKIHTKTAKQMVASMIGGGDLELLKKAITGRTETKVELIAYVQKQ